MCQYRQQVQYLNVTHSAFNCHCTLSHCIHALLGWQYLQSNQNYDCLHLLIWWSIDHHYNNNAHAYKYSSTFQMTWVSQPCSWNLSSDCNRIFEWLHDLPDANHTNHSLSLYPLHYDQSPSLWCYVRTHTHNSWILQFNLCQLAPLLWLKNCLHGLAEHN